MKKILTAFIEQVIQFDSKLEYLRYLEDMKYKPGKFKVIDEKQDASGKVFRTIRKQYNNNEFPD